MNPPTTPLPTTLVTPTPAEGLALARRLASELCRQCCKESPAPSLPGGTNYHCAPAPSEAQMAAVLFTAVSIANGHWAVPPA